MALIVTTDPAEVERLAGSAVARAPVAHTVFGTIAEAVRSPGAQAWAAYPHGASQVLAMRSQPDLPVVCTAGWTDLAELAARLRALAPVAVAGPVDTVTALADALGIPVTRRMDERLFRLDELVPPRPCDGSERLATEDDVPWLVDWYRAFGVEAFGYALPGLEELIAHRLPRSRCRVWVDDGGAPCSFAIAQPPVCGVSRIGPVYTPPAFRGRGYASAATAAASRDILDAGNVACLYTDLANPTSNKIYQAIGFTPVLDRVTLRFD